jgi:hypothetical protein
MALPLWDFACRGDLAVVDRMTSTKEGREKINTEMDGVRTLYASTLW